MSASTKKLRAAVFKRADGKCESCGKWVGFDGEEGHLDHFVGRAKATEGEENCWGLCPTCHEAKTLNQPSAADWVERFQKHCERYGYAAQLERLGARRLVIAAKAVSA